MQTEETVIELPDHVLSGQQIVEEPFLPELTEVRLEYGSCEGSEMRLVDSDEYILEVQGLQLEVPRLGYMPRAGRIQVRWGRRG